MVDKKKKKAAADEDDSTMLLDKVYDKKCKLNGVPKVKLLNEDYDDIESVIKLKINSNKYVLVNNDGSHGLCPVGVRALMEAMTEISYKHLKILRLVNVGGSDEGARTICIYMKKAQTIEYLALVKEGIGLLGCGFIGQALHPLQMVPLIKLKLDQNDFGSAGLKLLTEGLAMNSTLQKLSLCSCGIDDVGAQYIQEILSNVESKLEKLKMMGNQLGNKGTYQIFRALQINDMLQKINIADNQVNLNDTENSPELIKLMCEVMRENTSLIHYNFRFNILRDEDGQKIIECIEHNKNLYRVELPDKMPQAIIEKVKNLTKKRKPKKKGKGKKGKKKK